MLGENTWIDSALGGIVNTILEVLQVVFDFIFSNDIITLLFWYLCTNLIAILLMKKDKEYAQNDKRRIRESTLIMLALAGGAFGMYYAMYQYKHKTLHKKFTILVPLFMVLHFALLSYMTIWSIVK